MEHNRSRFNSLLFTREFLERVSDDAGLPAWVREEAAALVEHYPNASLLHDLAAREELVIRQFPLLGRSRVLITERDSIRRHGAWRD